MVAIVVFYALMAGVFTFGKEVVQYAQPFFLTTLRLPMAGLIFLLFEQFYNKTGVYINLSVAPYLLCYGIAAVCMDSARFIALTSLPAPNAALIASLAPFFAALVSYIFLKEQMTTKKFLALVIGFCAILPTLLSHLSAPAQETSCGTLVVAYLAAFVSMLGFVGTGLFIKLLTKRYNYPMFMIIGFGMICAGLLAFLISVHHESWTPLPFMDMPKALPYVGYLLVTHNLIAYPLYAYLLKHFPLTLIAFAQLLAPLFTALFRWVWFGEAVTLSFLFSFAVLVIALYVFYKEEEREGLIT